ncbi:uncharacterized protein LOC121905343 [Thunnus maccoyii]|uniref:uncharacterized protein LOC121905343 n=1 Tax=Thunnus maccoyii TaxID=8240 RepID=UPI001C4B16B2|nr:uncharacterized protein LOC121905343 [Thunnus maccoyii]
MRIRSSSDTGELSQKQKVTLSCTALTCTFHQLDVTWFKDGSALPQSGPALQLGPLTAKDSGNYTCGLKINTNTISLPYAVRVEEAEEKEKDEGAGSNLPLIAGLVFGVLLLLFTVILVLFIIRRRRSAADDGQAAVGGELDQKVSQHPDATYSSITEAAEQQRAERQQEVRQEVRPAAEDVNYAAVQFKHKSQARAAEEEEVDAVIYSAVASRR